MSSITPGNLDRVAAAALPLVGLSARGSPANYMHALGPGETPEIQHAMLTMSGCGLAAAAALRDGGYLGGELAPPYQIGSAVSRLVALARARSAWRTTPPTTRGAIFLIGGPGKGGPEHMGIVGAATPTGSGSFAIDVVQGGQLDASGAQLINRATRLLRVDETGWSIDGRRGVGWIDASALPFDEPSDPLGAIAALLVVGWAIS